MPQKVLGPVKLGTKKVVGGTMEIALMADMDYRHQNLLNRLKGMDYIHDYF